MKKVISRVIQLFEISSLVLLLIGCDKNDSNKTRHENKVLKHQQQLGEQLLSRDLEMGVIMLEAKIGNIQGGGGYQMWTATKMVDKLMMLRKSAATRGAHGAKERISYVKDKVKKPWQIVLIPDDSKKQIIVKAYGANINTPVITKKIRVSTY